MGPVQPRCRGAGRQVRSAAGDLLPDLRLRRQCQAYGEPQDQVHLERRGPVLPAPGGPRQRRRRSVPGPGAGNHRRYGADLRFRRLRSERYAWRVRAAAVRLARQALSHRRRPGRQQFGVRQQLRLRDLSQGERLLRARRRRERHGERAQAARGVRTVGLATRVVRCAQELPAGHRRRRRARGHSAIRRQPQPGPRACHRSGNRIRGRVPGRPDRHRLLVLLQEDPRRDPGETACALAWIPRQPVREYRRDPERGVRRADLRDPGPEPGPEPARRSQSLVQHEQGPGPGTGEGFPRRIRPQGGLSLGVWDPKWEGSVGTTVTIRGRLWLYGLVDFKLGNRHFDNNLRALCQVFLRCDENFNPQNYDILKIAELQSNNIAQSWVINKADFAKLREVSASYTFPRQIARMLGGRDAVLTLAGRNLHTWTGWTGLHPEAYFSTHLFARLEQDGTPQLASFMATLNITF